MPSNTHFIKKCLCSFVQNLIKDYESQKKAIDKAKEEGIKETTPDNVKEMFEQLISLPGEIGAQFKMLYEGEEEAQRKQVRLLLTII